MTSKWCEVLPGASRWTSERVKINAGGHCGRAASASSLPGAAASPGAGGGGRAWRKGGATGTVAPSPGGCGRPPPCPRPCTAPSSPMGFYSPLTLSAPRSPPK